MAVEAAKELKKTLDKNIFVPKPKHIEKNIKKKMNKSRKAAEYLRKLGYSVQENIYKVVVQLTHKSCCSGCISYLQDLKLCSTLISKK